MYQISEKGRGIREMFDAIAPRYDLLNRLLSFGIDRRWRKNAVGLLTLPANGMVLDVATGTGDVALEIASRTPATVQIIGADFTQGMLVHGRDKVAASPYAQRIQLVNAPCEELPFPPALFDAVTIAFGIRNVVDRPAGLREMCRVLKPGGRVVILEFSNPKSRTFKALYDFYFLQVLPRIGGLISRRSAYQYLPDSVQAFPPREDFMQMMQEAGFSSVTHHDQTFGIATIYTGIK